MADPLLEKAILLAQSGNAADAIQLLVHIVRADPENQEAWRWLVDLLPEAQRKAALLALLSKKPDSVQQFFAVIGRGDEPAEPLAQDPPGETEQNIETPPQEVDTAAAAADAAQAAEEAVDGGFEAFFTPPQETVETSPAAPVDAVSGWQQEMADAQEAAAPDEADPAADVVAPPEWASEEADATEGGDSGDALAGLFALSSETGEAARGPDTWEPEWRRGDASSLIEQQLMLDEAAPDPAGQASDQVVEQTSDQVVEQTSDQVGTQQSEAAFIDAVEEGGYEQAREEAQPARRGPNGCVVIGLALAGLVIVAGVILAALYRSGVFDLAAYAPGLASPTPAWTATLAASITPAASATPMPTATPQATDTPEPTPTSTETPLPSATPTAYAGQVIDFAVDAMPAVYIPAGSFVMGWRFGDPGETAEHEVALDAFWIDQREVTNQQYAMCVADGACTEPGQMRSYSRDAYYGKADYADYPVVFVNWEQASAYCAWAGRRLPTEAEWEYAARGDDQRLYPWGKDAPSQALANFNFYFADTMPVGSFAEGASPFGVLDMAGNVAEWVNDWYFEQFYARSPALNPAGPSEGQVRTFRGGSFANLGDKLRVTRRGHDQPLYASSSIGIRCAADAP